MPVHGRHWVAFFVLLCLALTGGGSAARAAPPLLLAGDFEAGGDALGSSGPSGVDVPFVEGGQLRIGIVLRNTSGRPLTVVDVRTPEPANSLVREGGTRLVRWSPPNCPPDSIGCPITGFLGPWTGASRPAPTAVTPGATLGVQLNYGLATCRDAPTASTASASSLVVTYRTGSASSTETLPIGQAQLHLNMPAPNDCLEPHSRIAFTGPYATSSAQTVPGSYGDTCTRTSSGGVLYRSALFESGSKPSLTVSIFVPALRGTGAYPAAQVLVRAPGVSGENTFPLRSSTVRVAHATGTTLSGSFSATVVAYRTPFRASGNWRCTTLGSVSLGDTEARVSKLWDGRYGVCQTCSSVIWESSDLGAGPLAVAVRFDKGRVATIVTAASLGKNRFSDVYPTG